MNLDEELKGKESLILNSLGELVIYRDRDLNIVWANAKAGESANKAPSSLKGQKCYQIWGDANSPCEDCPVIKAMENGEIYKGETNSPDGRYWKVTVSPVKNDKGEIIGTIEVGIEITDLKKRENKLKKQKDLLRGVIDGIPDILIILNPDFTIKEINKAGYQVLGMKPEELKGKKCYELQGWGEKCEDCAVQKSLKTKQLERIKKYNSKLDMYIDCYSNPILDDQGNVIQIIEQKKDITAEEIAKQELEKEKQFINSVLETQWGLVVVLDTKGRIVRFNSACEKVTGYSFSEVKGKKVWDIFIIDEEMENTKSIFAELLSRKFPNQNENYWRTKEGELRLISWANNVITNEQSDIEYIVATGIDITEKNQVIKELRAKDKAIHNSDAAFAFTNKDGLITEVNNAFLEMWDYDNEEEVLGLTPFDFHPSTETEKIAKSLEQIKSKSGTWQDELRAVKADGSEFEVHLSSTVIKDQTGKMQGIMASFIDITESKEIRRELRKAKQKAEAANKAKSEFIANMSHEIRTPLNAVIGFSEILEKELKDSKYQGYLNSIKDAGTSLLKLINNILDISKIEAGHLEIKKEWFDPCALLQEMESIFAYRAEEKGITFIEECDLFSAIELESDLLEIKLDETRIRQILINLVGNAVKFTNKGYVKLSVQAEKTDNSRLYLEFIVEDTGIGISKGEQETIFKAFTQQQNQSFEYEGTGLGLTICHRLSKQMGGKIELESTVDKGSTFKIIFPEVEYKIKRNINKGIANTNLINFNSQQVLVIDDMKSNLEVLKIKLESKGLKVLTATSGREAVELAEKHQPQLIIIDLKMPFIDGYQAKQLIEIELEKETPIIALTAFATVEEKKKVWESGFDAFLTKPINEKNLFKELTKHLAYNRQEKKIDISVTAEDISVEETVDLESLIQTLENDLLVKYKELKDLMIINEIEEFAKQLIKLAEDYGVASLSSYAQKLLEYAENFDLDNLRIHLSDFPAWVEKLKQLNDN
ncbi:PAS domain-containing hybrid sensor histidine kinase/response regulator [Fuchsiella alkaliacetigena]|uniref:PAS domain-containing hybrid sensor histidine kinase/response regulator n=1 Tax=Fuchsiella alkaliacetigena TaxID=957042 RepID=UPI00200B1991|nr:PAS domain-containing protein [Fuchsiella alkaliacetigena]MCK8826084.1 PAS domain S-box protein [Fuchsiella alkaliacetigena]